MEDSSSSSVVSGLCQPSFLQRTLDRLSSTQSLKLSAEEAAPVAVVALQRYLSEKADGRQADSYTYDVTLTDGLWRAKFWLHPSLNHLVHRNKLKTGGDVSVRRCSFVYDERRLGHGYVCVEELSCCAADGSAVLPGVRDVCSLPVLVKQGMERSQVLLRDVPLQGGRKHYLPLWNNDDPEGDIWTSGSPTRETVLDVSKVTLLSSLESSRASGRPLLVKIIHKSRLRYYGKFGLKIDYPYQAYFEVADQSGTMSLVLWNELCPEFYQRMTVGAVLYLQNYTLKQSYSNRSRPQMAHHGMKNFTSTEICLNPHSPASVITVVPAKSVLPQWGLPGVSYQFTCRSELEKLANNSACDVIGLVTFVGRVERVKSKGNKAPEKYWTYRWAHAVDGTSEQPFILELFSSSQPEIFSQICPMTYLVCTQMRVCQAEGSSPYLTSSCETEIFVTGHHRGQPYVSDPRVKSFIQWTKTLRDDAVLQRTAVGGHYCYPPLPKIFTQSTDSSGRAPLVAAADLKTELDTLQYREHKRVAIQGQITAVRYTNAPHTTETQEAEEDEVLNDEQGRVTPESRHRLSAAEQTAAETLGSPSADRRKRRIQDSKSPQASLTSSSTPSKRRLGDEETHERTEPEEEEVQSEEGGQEPAALSWQSSSWSEHRQELSDHLRHGGLRQDSVCRSFTSDERSALLRRLNLQPTRWAPEPAADPLPPVSCPGHYQLTILGINKRIAVDAAFLPVARADDPRAVGRPQEPHDNTMLSCLSSGFLCPLGGEAAPPEPEEVLATAPELEGAHLVCILDLCHLGGDEVEVLINKVYKVTEASLE
ncbi:RPA-related protein RADX [Kryptolebias marmoratus]|uniref:RPA-related protein RADX n=1 Tax=Kryptolebias marmoratus TaxID=37003 RepID=UPI0007F8A4FF|nr:RPA-related protein RADX [Kryptolebias marmoratus]